MKNLNIFSFVTEYDNDKSGGVLNVPNVSFVDEDNSIRYLLENIDPYNGYEYVDLGLPSGLKWAICNVGATLPEQVGLYFAWGETTGYTTEQVTSGVRTFSQDEYNAGPAASISADLTLEQDAAHVNLGGNWRMPTEAEYKELINNCDASWIDDYNGTGISGPVFISKTNGNSVFFPTASGYCDSFISDVGLIGKYWSSSWNGEFDRYYLDIYSDSYNVISMYGYPYCGFSVRGVCK